MDESKLYAYCLQGDVIAAFDYLQSFTQKSKKLEDLENKYKRRFFTENPNHQYKSSDPWVRKVLLAYYNYFTAVLTRKSVQEAESHLISALSPLLPGLDANMDLDQIEEELMKEFASKGLSFLGGVTTPFRGPYIWKTIKKKEFQVELPSQKKKVTVYFLSNFILLSWLHFATFGKKYAGGWAKEEGLYYVDEGPRKINIESSEFQVSYLKHEAQHLDDYQKYPNLQVKDLEYRAKLIELIYEPNSFRLLKKFFYEKKNDIEYPHPYSSFVIMGRMSELAFGKREEPSLDDWMMVDPRLIQSLARELFEEHTEKLLDHPKGII